MDAASLDSRFVVIMRWLYRYEQPQNYESKFVFQASARLWPEIFNTPMAEARKLELVEKMRAVRPVIETGWVRGTHGARSLRQGGSECTSFLW